MSSAVVMENSKPLHTTHGFSVTVGFNPANTQYPPLQQQTGTRTLAFPIPANVQPPSSALSHLTLKPTSSSMKQDSTSFMLRSALFDKRKASLDIQHSRPVPLSVTPPTDMELGWKAMLDISRNSGASGVVSCRPCDEEAKEEETKIEVCCTVHTTNNVKRLMRSVIKGLKACQEPDKAKEGMGGTYFFSDEKGRKTAILKPCDEEALAPNNPKGYVGRSLGEPGWKPTIRVGEAAMREVAAYLLDDGWAKVPTSVLVRARHPIFCYNNRMSSARQSSMDLASIAAPQATLSVEAPGSTGTALPMKLGSLQEFVNHICDTSEMGPSKFSMSDVHRIGVLDIRLFNTDRHAGNMLVREVQSTDRVSSMGGGGLSKLATLPMGRPQYELVPIDHGFCLPETLEACYFEWQHWPQAMLPFTQEELDYISNINIENDKALLRKELLLRSECLRVMEVSTTLLKRCAEAGLTLHDIANIMTRPFENGDEEPSDLERTVASALEAMKNDDFESLDCEDIIEEDDEETDEDNATGRASVDMSPTDTNFYGRALSNRSSTNLDGMFILDEDGTPHSHEHIQHSHNVFSLGSSVSSAEDFSFAMNSNGAVASETPSAARPRRQDTSSTTASDTSMRTTASDRGVRTQAQPISALATSVHTMNGIWMGMHKQPNTRSTVKNNRPPGASRRANALAKKAGGLHVYPPPVVAVKPESVSSVFKDMDEDSFKRFMEVWMGILDAELRTGKWRVARAVKDIPASCPRF